MSQSDRLADFAGQVRASTLKRFRKVAVQDRGWRPGPERLSFADHLVHLVDCDCWVLAVLQGMPEPDAEVKPGDGDVSQWDNYLKALEVAGKSKAEFYRGLTDEQLDCVVESPARMGSPEVALLILRENLEHEIQHRGSVQLMLRLKYG
jgi:uncharacterized damage-inducible protein DinB